MTELGKRLSAQLTKQLWSRARAQNWLNAKGKFSASGRKMALEFVIGFAAAFAADEESPEWKWASLTAFLCSVRGVEEILPEEGKASE